MTKEQKIIKDKVGLLELDHIQVEPA